MSIRAMGRRRFLVSGLALAGLGLLSGCSRVSVVQPRPMARIGFPSANSMEDPIVKQQLAGLRKGLDELGYVEQRDYVIEYRGANGKFEEIPDVVAQFVNLPVDVIVGQSSITVGASKRATSSIPIVFAATPDPVGQGLIENLARPGGNVTGLALTPSLFGGKQLELLKEAVPTVVRVAMLANPANGGAALGAADMRLAAQRVGIETDLFEVRAAGDFPAAFEAVRAWRADSMVVLNDALITLHLKEIFEFVEQNRLPAAYTFKEYAEAGGLLGLSASVFELWRRAATYVDKILKGAKPADLPVEQPAQFECVINLKAAQALGITIQPSALQQATQIIQ